MRDKLCFLAVVLVMAGACQSQQTAQTITAGPRATQEAAYATLLPVQQTNKFVSLRPYEERNRETLSISLWVENISQEELVFPYDWGAEIYAWVPANQSWVQIANRAMYSPSPEIVLGPAGSRSSMPALLVVRPEFPEGLSVTSTIRVSIRGYIIQNGVNGGKSEIAGFVDVDASK